MAMRPSNNGTSNKSAEIPPVDISSIFKPATELTINDGLKIGVYGVSKVGKTEFGCSAVRIRGVLKPVYIVDTEGNAKKLTARMTDEERKFIFIAEVIKHAKVDIVGEHVDKKKKKKVSRIDLVASLNAIDVAIDAITKVVNNTPLCEDGSAPGTIIIDSATDPWKWIGTWLEEGGDGDVKTSSKGNMPRFEWGKANKRYMEFIYLLLDSGWHVVMTFRSEPVVNEKGENVGMMKPRMQKDTTHWLDMLVELKYDGVNYSSTFRGDRYGNISGSILNTTFSGLLDHIEKVSGARIL